MILCKIASIIMVHQIYNKNRQDYTPVGQTWYRVRQEIKEMERTLAEFIAIYIRQRIHQIIQKFHIRGI